MRVASPTGPVQLPAVSRYEHRLFHEVHRAPPTIGDTIEAPVGVRSAFPGRGQPAGQHDQHVDDERKRNKTAMMPATIWPLLLV